MATQAVGGGSDALRRTPSDHHALPAASAVPRPFPSGGEGEDLLWGLQGGEAAWTQPASGRDTCVEASQILREMPLSHAEVLYQLPAPGDPQGSVQVVRVHYAQCLFCRRSLPQAYFVGDSFTCVDCSEDGLTER
eukprot:GGOE01036638.1.p3 GENE.GGOE01036638.1~~GGOE01036638.1.p3  ORF type:complete len:135 (-),score=23.31 GGOE01036638.1:99-503(-)